MVWVGGWSDPREGSTDLGRREDALGTAAG